MADSLIKINIKVADRDFPMQVNAGEEARFRTAGRLLNERIKQFRDEYGLSDQQYLLSMIALESVVERLLAEERVGAADSGMHQRLEHLHDLLLTASTGPTSGSGLGTGGGGGGGGGGVGGGSSGGGKSSASASSLSLPGS